MFKLLLSSFWTIPVRNPPREGCLNGNTELIYYTD